MNENGDRREETRRKIELARLRFVGREAGDVATRLALFVDHADDLGLRVPSAQYRNAMELYTYLREFEREAAF